MGEENNSSIFIQDTETGKSFSFGEIGDISIEHNASADVIGWTVGVNTDDNGVTIHFKLMPTRDKFFRKLFGINNNWRKRHGLPMYRAINKRGRHA